MPSKLRASPVLKASLIARVTSCLSFVAALVVSGILGFFINALRRAYLPVPWPIVLIMAVSCFNIISTFAIAIIRCVAPDSSLLLPLVHAAAAISWLVAVALLGSNLDEHLRSKCPRPDEQGYDLHLVCHLFKALFAFATVATFSTFIVVAPDISAWRQSKNTKYTAIEKNAGVMAQSARTKRRGKLGALTEIFKKNKKEIQEDERDIMLGSVHSEGVERKVDMIGPDQGISLEPLRMYMPSPDMGPRQRVHVDGHANQFDGHANQFDGHANQFDGQETRYDPGGRVF